MTNVRALTEYKKKVTKSFSILFNYPLLGPVCLVLFFGLEGFLNSSVFSKTKKNPSIFISVFPVSKNVYPYFIQCLSL